jgi:hypothetical protein
MKRVEFILFGLGCVLLAALVWTIGPGELWNELRSLGWGLLAFFAAEGLAEAIHTLGWRLCLPKKLHSLPYFFLFRVRAAGYAINFLTPTAALGGEVTKISLLSSRCAVSEATSGVLISKLCFAIAHLLFVALGSIVIVRSVHFTMLQWIPMLLGGVLVTSGIFTFFILQKNGKLGTLLRWLASKNIGGTPLKKAANVLTAVDGELQSFYRDRQRDMWCAIGWHLLGYLIGIIPTWYFLERVAPPAAVSIAATAWFLGMAFDLITFAVPLNAGSLEGTRVLALKVLGYAAPVGMAYGIALRAGQTLWAIAGLGLRATFGTVVKNPSGEIVYSRDRNKSHRDNSANDWPNQGRPVFQTAGKGAGPSVGKNGHTNH